MRALKAQHWLYNFFACVLFSTLCAMGPALGSESYDVIVNPGVSEQTLSKNAVRAIFAMRLQTWPDGSPVKVFVLADDHPAHIGFSKEILNVFPYQLRAAWDRLVFSGTGQAPIEVSSEKEMRAKVAGTPGAIGYLKGLTASEQVRVLQIK